MKVLNVESRLEYARAGVAVLRALSATNPKQTMRYQEFARAIGLIGQNERWEAWHMNQVSDLLYLISAVQEKADSRGGDDTMKLEFNLLVGADDKPGAGFGRTARIVVED